MKFFFGLSRCPVCRERASSSLGCCESCAGMLFQTEQEGFELSLGTYGGRLERAVRALKFHGITRLAGLFGARLAAETVKAGWPLELVCAVPLHPRRRLGRGYNQSALIARHAARRLGLPYRRPLKRSRATDQQARLSLSERRNNVAGAFVAGSKAAGVLQHKHVLLVDDVITSGATTLECSLTLLEAGAARVYVAAIARAKTNSSR